MNNKLPFADMTTIILGIGAPDDGIKSEDLIDSTWDLECRTAFEFGGWQEQEFWDEYYRRKAHNEILDLTNQ